MLKRLSSWLFEELTSQIPVGFVAFVKEQAAAGTETTNYLISDTRNKKITRAALENVANGVASNYVADLLTDIARKVGYVENAVVSSTHPMRGTISGKAENGVHVDIAFSGEFVLVNGDEVAVRWKLKLAVDGVRVPVSKWRRPDAKAA